VEPATDAQSTEVEGLIRNLQALFRRLVQLSPMLPTELAVAAENMDDAGRLADFVAANSDFERAQSQEMLEQLDPLTRARRVTEIVTREVEVLEIGSRLQSHNHDT